MRALVELAELDKCKAKTHDNNGNVKVIVRVGAELFHFVYCHANLKIITFLPTK